MGPPTAAHPALVPFAPAKRRTAVVHGAPVELVLVPERKARHGRADAARPAFTRSPAARIVGEECLWQGDGFVLTPNRYPFAREQRILWPQQPVREPDPAFWQVVFDWVARSGGSALVNNVGAAATIGRAHAHLVPERLPFLEALPECELRTNPIDAPAAIRIAAKAVPFCLLGLRGPIAARATAMILLAEARMTATWNVVAYDDVVWICPRRCETPDPHFPYALGAAELWGRWCYMDDAPFEQASAGDLEAALALAGMPPLP